MTERIEGAHGRGQGQGPGLGICLGFGVGTIGTAVLLNTVTVYLPAFMATVLGQSVALAGLLLTISKLYDVVCDIVIGIASDRTVSRLGRRRPYLLAGALVGSVAFCVLFDPPFVSGHAVAWEMGFLLSVYSTGYSLFNVPYLAIPPDIAPGYHARTRLLSFRTFFVSVGQFIALSVSGWLLHAVGGGRHGYAIMGYALASVIVLTELGTFFGVGNGSAATASTGSGGAAGLRSVFANRPFGLLMGAKFMQLLGVSVSISTSVLFMLNVLGAGYLGQANLSLAQNIAIGLSMPAWVRISRRIGKRICAMIAIGIYTLGALSWLFAGAGEPTIGIVLRAVVLGVAAGGILLMGSSMLPDAMEYGAIRTGAKHEGIYSSFFAIVEKAAFAIGPGLIGVALAESGYIPTLRGQIVQQPHAVRTALYVGTAILPAAMMAISILFLLVYRLDEAALLRLRADAAAVPAAE